jgi:hypothetical protein
MSSQSIFNTHPLVALFTLGIGIGIAIVAPTCTTCTTFEWLKQGFKRPNSDVCAAAVVPTSEPRSDTTAGGPCSDSDLIATLTAARSMIMKTNSDIQEYGQRVSRNEKKIAMLQETAIEIQEDVADNRRKIAINSLRHDMLEEKTNARHDMLEEKTNEHGNSIIILSLTVLALLFTVAFKWQYI